MCFVKGRGGRAPLELQNKKEEKKTSAAAVMGVSKNKYRKKVNWKEHWSRGKRNKKMKGFNKRKEMKREVNWENGRAFRLVVYAEKIHKAGFDDDFKLEGYKEGGKVSLGSMKFDFLYEILRSSFTTDYENLRRRKKRKKKKKRKNTDDDEEEEEEEKESFRILRMAIVLPKPIETYSEWKGRVENAAKPALEMLKEIQLGLSRWNIDFSKSTTFHTSCSYLKREGYCVDSETYHGSVGYVYTFKDLELIQNPE
ncbi:MAG: hypothetical protein ACTSUE_10605 [Promethearchaeota archaeon]